MTKEDIIKAFVRLLECYREDECQPWEDEPSLLELEDIL